MSLLSISEVLAPEALAKVHDALDGVTWTDGRATAGRVAQAVKRNEQAKLNAGPGLALRETLAQAVADHPVMQAAARPKRWSKIMVSRTSEGGHYGAHIDNALMGTGAGRLRTDLSFTLFLSPPDAYEGGELIIHGAGGSQSHKGEAGDLALYSSTEIHEVTPVTQGERIVAVGWIESLIRDPAQRALLFDLENLRVSLRAQLDANAIELLTLDKSIANLLRMWSAP